MSVALTITVSIEHLKGETSVNTTMDMNVKNYWFLKIARNAQNRLLRKGKEDEDEWS
jgi:hypothetical protein